MAAAPVSRWSITLGLFVTWQVVYLPLANLTQVVPRERIPERGDWVIDIQEEGQFTTIRPVQGAVNLAGAFVDRWSEVTGQQQNFKMFCPKLPDVSLSPAVVVMFDDGSTKRIEAPIRHSLFAFREHHREANTVALAWHLTPTEIDRDPAKVFLDYQVLANARIRTARSYVKRIAEAHGAKRAELHLQFATKPPASFVTDERPFLRFDFSKEIVELFNAATQQFEVLSP